MPYGNVGKIKQGQFGSVRKLASCDLFTAELLSLDGETELSLSDSFISLLVLDGELDLEWDGGVLSAKKGGSIFIPADFTVKISGKAEILYSRV